MNAYEVDGSADADVVSEALELIHKIVVGLRDRGFPDDKLACGLDRAHQLAV